MEGYLIEEDQSAGGRGVLVPVHSALSGGQPAPLSAQARISAPNAACVPGAGVRRPPGIQAQPTRLSSDTWWSSASMSFAPLRAGSLICSQIAPSERPCHPMDAGARRQAPPRRRSCGVMAGAAGKARRAVSVDAAHDPGPVRLHAVGLGWSVVHGMTVQAARIQQDLARFPEQGDRSRVRAGKRLGLTERALRRGA
jgi:hypothetical protein